MLKVAMNPSAKVYVALALAAALTTGCMPDVLMNEHVETPQTQAAAPGPAQVMATTPVEGSMQPVSTEAPSEPPASEEPPPQTIDGTTANPAALASGEEVPIGEEPAATVPAATAEPPQYQETDPSALTDFRPALEPYGAWEDDSTYGTVWYPSAAQVGPDFTPYSTGGHWSHDGTEYVWVSDYEWGWAPFHYGRWIYIAGRGWAWVPGRVYRGAWVTWRVGPAGYGYIGWAPMVPTWYWYRGYAYGIGVVPHAPYSFCATHDLFHPHVGGRVIRGQAVVSIARGTRPFVDATPGIGGAPRVGATPGRGPESTGHSRYALTNQGHAGHGPAPGLLGVKPSQVVKTPNDSPSFSRAKDFGNPSMRAKLGLSALPQRQAMHPIAVRPPPSYPSDSRFGGAPRRTHQPEVNPSFRAPAHVYRPSIPSAHDPSPRFSHAPSEPAAPRLHQTPPMRPSSPAFRPSAPSMRPAAPTFRPSAPSVRPSAPSVRPSAPTFRPSSPSFRPSTPSVRPSTPSHSSRPSSPSRGSSRGGRR